jgi:hypothetical protein
VRLSYLVAAAVALLAPSLTLRADTITSYSSLSALQTASSTTLWDDFAGSNLQGLTYTSGPFTYQGTARGIYIDVDRNGYQNSVTSSYAKYISANSGKSGSITETISFAATNAVGFYLGDYYGGETLTFAVDGSTFVYTLPAAGGSSGDEVFAGFSSTGNFSSLTITGTNQEIDVIQAYYGTAATSVTPEPSSLALLGTGLLGIVGVLRKRLV